MAELLVLPVVVLVSAALSPTYASREFLITRLSEREFIEQIPIPLKLIGSIFRDQKHVYRHKFHEAIVRRVTRSDMSPPFGAVEGPLGLRFTFVDVPTPNTASFGELAQPDFGEEVELNTE